MAEPLTLTQKVDRILMYLESDHATNQEGLVEKVNRHDRMLANFKSKASGMAIVLTIIFNIAFWLLNKFIK